jgi:hypothetical protein
MKIFDFSTPKLPAEKWVCNRENPQIVVGKLTIMPLGEILFGRY